MAASPRKLLTDPTIVARPNPQSTDLIPIMPIGGSGLEATTFGALQAGVLGDAASVVSSTPDNITASLIAARDVLPVEGGQMLTPAGLFTLDPNFQIGSGVDGQPSASNGTAIIGAGTGAFYGPFGTYFETSATLRDDNASMMIVQGETYNVRLERFSLNCNDLTGVALAVVGSRFFTIRDLCGLGFTKVGLNITTHSEAAGQFNNFGIVENVLFASNVDGHVGFGLSGTLLNRGQSIDNDTWLTSIRNSRFDTGSASRAFAVSIGFADSMVWQQVHMTGNKPTASAGISATTAGDVALTFVGGASATDEIYSGAVMTLTGAQYAITSTTAGDTHLTFTAGASATGGILPGMAIVLLGATAEGVTVQKNFVPGSSATVPLTGAVVHSGQATANPQEVINVASASVATPWKPGLSATVPLQDAIVNAGHNTVTYRTSHGLILNATQTGLGGDFPSGHVFDACPIDDIVLLENTNVTETVTVSSGWGGLQSSAIAPVQAGASALAFPNIAATAGLIPGALIRLSDGSLVTAALLGWTPGATSIVPLISAVVGFGQATAEWAVVPLTTGCVNLGENLATWASGAHAGNVQATDAGDAFLIFDPILAVLSTLVAATVITLTGPPQVIAPCIFPNFPAGDQELPPSDPRLPGYGINGQWFGSFGLPIVKWRRLAGSTPLYQPQYLSHIVYCPDAPGGAGIAYTIDQTTWLILGGQWTSFTPVLTPAGGTLNVTAATGRMILTNKMLSLVANFTIGSGGSPTGTPTLTLPVAAVIETFVGQGKGVDNKMLQGVASGSGMPILNYDGTNPALTAGSIFLQASYEVA